MSESLSVGRAVARPVVGAPEPPAAVLDVRRKLQLALAVIWLLDGILQYQPFMFTKAFPQMLAGTSSGNPAVVASPITWSATFIDHHLVVVNAIFATIQLALGLGIAWRPTVKLALAASVAWALGVWWFGEGPRRDARRQRQPGQRRSRCGDPLRAARGPAMARRPGPRRAVRRRPGRGPRCRPGAVAGAVGRAWRSSPCSPRPGRRGPSAA